MTCGSWGSSDLPRDNESLESYITSFDATLDEPVPSCVMDTVAKLRDPSVTYL